MSDLKIIFTGPPGAGKTTAITAMSDRAPVVTDVRNTDATLGKEMTTVGLDFGQVSLGDGQFVRLDQIRVGGIGFFGNPIGGDLNIDHQAITAGVPTKVAGISSTQGATAE